MKNLRILPVFAILMVLGMVACQKDKDHKNSDCTDDREEINLSEDFNAALLEEFDNMEIYGDLETDLKMENDGIPEILDEFTFEDEAASTGKRRNPCNNLKLDKKQLLALQNAWASYKRCRETSIRNLRQLHRKAISQAHAQREQLVRLLRTNEITKAEFETRMHKLRSELRDRLKNQGHSMREAILRCHTNYRSSVKAIIGAKDYENWMHCLKSRLRKKALRDGGK